MVKILSRAPRGIGKKPRHIGKNKAARRMPSMCELSRRCRFEQMEPREMLAADFLAGPGGDFGQPGGPTGSVSGSVFAAQSLRCGTHSDGASLTGVRVQLLDAAGNVVLERTTDEHGKYEFPGLVPGKYSIVQIAPLGFLGGQSQVGEGGGISLNSNQVDSVWVQPGIEVAGYDFCDISLASIDELQGGVLLGLSFQSQEIPRQPLVAVESRLESFSFTVDTVQAPVLAPQLKAFVGSPSQLLPPRPAETLLEWKESPLDSELSTANFLKIASGPRQEANTLEALNRGLDVYGESRDTLFADGYTTNSLEWWDEESLIELDQLMGDAEIIHLGDEQAEATPVDATKVARRSETHPAEPVVEAQTR